MEELNSKKYNYKIFPNLNLSLEAFTGSFNLSEMIENRTKLYTDKEFSLDLNLISDFNDAIITYLINDLRTYLTNAKKAKFLNKRKTAIIVSSVNQHVYATEIAKVSKELEIPIEFKLFSNLTDAIDWLGLSSNNQNIIKEVEKMRKKLKEDNSN